MKKMDFIYSSQLNKIATLFLFTFLLCIIHAHTDAQNQVNVNVIVKQPVSPFVSELAADFCGNYMQESLIQKVQIRLTNNRPEQKRIKLGLRIERLSPEPGAIYTSAQYQPITPIILMPNQTKILTAADLNQAFENFSSNNFIYENLTLKEIREHGINYKLPEGQYRLCINVYDYDSPGHSRPLAPLFSGCAYFNICYTAAAPQFIAPFNTMGEPAYDFKPFTPTGPQILFNWTAPVTTCGVPTGPLSYELKIREAYPGQTVSDAKRNPPVFTEYNIHTNMFIFDTTRYLNVLRNGGRYVVQVKAKLLNTQNSPIEIANGGYSEPIAFIYEAEEEFITEEYAIESSTEIDCGLPDIENKKLFQGDISGKEIQVGEFTMEVNEATKEGKSYQGTGNMLWAPYGYELKLAVEFTDIQVNTDMKLVSGYVVTTVADGYKEIVDWTAPELVDEYFSGKINDFINRINVELQPLQKLRGEVPIDFPVGIADAEMGNTSTNLSITRITFSEKGSNMEMFYATKIQDAGPNAWLSLAGKGFCINPEGFDGNGELYLPTTRSFELSEGVELKLKGRDTESNESEQPINDYTHLKWTSEGLDSIFAEAELIVKSGIKPVDSEGERLDGEVVKMKTRFTFKAWDDWIATLVPSHDFEIEEMPGFIISAEEGLFFDHSIVKNPNVSKWPVDGNGKVFLNRESPQYMGLYIKELTMTLPKDFMGTDDKQATFTFTDFFLNMESGLWVDIYGTDVLQSGRLDRWAFSIDEFQMKIKEWVPSDARMKGDIGLPISEDRLPYSCNLNSPSDPLRTGYAFQFIVEVDEKAGYNVPMWAANFNLSPETNIIINKPRNEDLILYAALYGDFSINITDVISDKNKEGDIPKIELDIAEIRGLTVANHNRKGKKEFYFDPGFVRFGNKHFGEDVNQGPGTGFLPSYHEDISEYMALNSDSYSGPAKPILTLNDAEKSILGSVKEDTRYVGDHKVAGFPIQLKEFWPVFEVEGNKLKLGFKFDLDMILGEEGTGFSLSGETTVKLYGTITVKPKEIDLPERPEIEVNKVDVAGDFGPVSVDGSLLFFNEDIDYGDGIYGDATIAISDFMEIEAQMFMGEKESFDYYGFGGKVKFGMVGIPMGPTPIYLNGFGGGFYKNMAIEEVVKDGTTLGLKPSKEKMVFEASIYGYIVQKKVLKAGLELSIEVNSNGGINTVKFDGNTNIISSDELMDFTFDEELNKYTKGKDNGLINGKFEMQYADGKFDAYVEIRGEIDITGSSIVIPIWFHADKSDFFLYAGHPGGEKNKGYGGEFSRIELELVDYENDWLDFYLGGDAYLCMGTRLPQFPKVPQKVSNFLGAHVNATKGQSDAKVMNLIQNQRNRGFMFGASVNGRLDLEIAAFYLNMEATAGYDVALLNFNDADCGEGRAVIGYKNWYGVGQLYAYFYADIGLKVDTWFYTGKASLASMGLGASFQAGLPNPTWMSGRVRVKGSVLGGLISINTSVDINVGESDKPCIPAGNPLENLTMITEVGPEGENVDVFVNPYVVFSMPMSNNKEHRIALETNDSDGNPITRIYKFKVKDVSITQSEGDKKGKKVQGLEYYYSTDGNTMTIVNPSVYEELTEHKIEVTCVALELENGRWRTPQEYRDEKKYSNGFTQDSIVYFTSGIAPDSISEKHVVFSYPILGQKHLLKEEFNGQGSLYLRSTKK